MHLNILTCAHIIYAGILNIRIRMSTAYSTISQKATQIAQNIENLKTEFIKFGQHRDFNIVVSSVVRVLDNYQRKIQWSVLQKTLCMLFSCGWIKSLTDENFYKFSLKDIRRTDFVRNDYNDYHNVCIENVIQKYNDLFNWKVIDDEDEVEFGEGFVMDDFDKIMNGEISEKC